MLQSIVFAGARKASTLQWRVLRIRSSKKRLLPYRIQNAAGSSIGCGDKIIYNNGRDATGPCSLTRSLRHEVQGGLGMHVPNALRIELRLKLRLAKAFQG
jgi:hypothetical protein